MQTHLICTRDQRLGAFENPKIKVKSQEVLVRPWSNRERREKRENTEKNDQIWINKVDKEGSLADNPSLRPLDGLDCSIKNMLTKRHAKLSNDTFLPQGPFHKVSYHLSKEKEVSHLAKFHASLTCLMNVQMALEDIHFSGSY